VTKHMSNFLPFSKCLEMSAHVSRFILPHATNDLCYINISIIVNDGS
jgi:hypothetical protein